jgi:hypothetical protein
MNPLTLFLFRYVERTRRWFRLKYDSLLGWLRVKSSLLAAVFPHMLLLLLVGVFVYFLPDIFAAVSGGWLLVVLTLLYPLKASVDAVNTADKKEMGQWLMYWVILAILFSLHMLLNIFMIADFILAYVPRKEQLVFVVLLWLLLPWTDGIAWLYGMLLRLMDRFVRIPQQNIINNEQKTILQCNLRLHFPLFIFCFSFGNF